MLIALLLAPAACTVGPDYHKPQVAVPQHWSRDDPTPQPVLESTAPKVNLARWWLAFHDPVLDRLVSTALASNLDLRIARSRIREARAQRGVVKAANYPDIDASAAYERVAISQSILPQLAPSSTGVKTSPVSAPIFFPTTTDFYQAGFDASWELDVFGGIRRDVEAATADLQAAQESRSDMQVTLLAEIGRDYIEVRAYQQRIAITVKNIAAQTDFLNLTQQRYRGGVTTELDVTQAQALLATTEAQLPFLEQNLIQAIHGLGVLLGQEPNAVAALLKQPSPVPPSLGQPAAVPVGLPSDLLRRRPDIRNAERQLAAATARIGVATADLYPKFSLTGTAGFQSFSPATLFDSKSLEYAVGPTVTVPIFEGGRIHANIEVQNARQAQALDAYRRTILGALRDVEDSLTAYEKETARRRSLAQAVAANRQSVQISQRLYTAGTGTYLPVLDAQRSLFMAEDQLVQSDQTQTENLIALYKALGGGWE